MRVIISPTQLSGTIKAIASKSMAHRLLICSALADAPTNIICEECSQDIDATADCLRALGCDIKYEKGIFKVTPASEIPREAFIDCGESGSTLRFLLPVVCALGVRTTIKMHGRLPERPLSPLWEELERHGCKLSKSGDTIKTEGKLSAGRFSIAANISSQFVSGLLFALPVIDGKCDIELIGNVESEGYIHMTLEAQRRFGVDMKWRENLLAPPENASYRSAKTVEVEGDWSNGAFWICADAMSAGKITCLGLREGSVQGDRAVSTLKDEILMGGARIDAGNIPDLVPVLSVLAAAAEGVTVFEHAERLRIKESDRIQSVVSMLKALGADAEETENGLKVSGHRRLNGGTVDSCNDHRIAMSAAIASIICERDVVVENAQAVKKSYPGFWSDFVELGGKIKVEE